MFPWAAIGTALRDWVGEPEYVLATVMGIWLIGWVYKGIYDAIVSHTSQTVERADKTLEIYGALETLMLRVLRDTKDKDAQNELLAKIGESYPYVSDSLFEELTKYIRSLDMQQLRYCLGQIQEETPRLRTKYEERIPEIHTNFDETFFWIKMIAPQLKAIGITLFWLCVGSILTVFILGTMDVPNEQRASIILSLISLCFFVFFAYSLISSKEYRTKATLLQKIIPAGFLLTFFFTWWVYKLIVICAVIFLLDRVTKNRKLKKVKRQGNYM
ncbi:hypothetical protein CIG75_04515 [Tumebacillus algifaecis]|uniref:Uncharacterized protein n=1 Tax=Tumebacillus algifaecis TaxID=1214604 RepID=A0A223CY45_9BACL|nr:hypothetical protein [Tumebacillus algifaecis]ASS74319.1 hypothetical protein CIG75_04515 [Tumebacillus algifaecis]